MDGVYSVNILGTGTGPYLLQLTSVDTQGNSKTRVVRGTTFPGKQEALTITRAGVPGSPFSVSSSSVPTRIPGDVDLNGQVDIDDITLIQNALVHPADGVDDPRDLDKDGQITALDARRAALLCTFARCARN
jgi:hypothetical protein